MNIPTIQTFSFTPSGQPQEARRLRVQNIDGAPWFVLRDVIIGMGSGATNPDACSARIAALKKRGQLGEVFLEGPRGARAAYTTNLDGLSGVISRSSLPDVEEFRYWLEHNILPKLTAKVVPVPAAPVPPPKRSLDAELKAFDAKAAAMRDAFELAWYRQQTAQAQP